MRIEIDDYTSKGVERLQEKMFSQMGKEFIDILIEERAVLNPSPTHVSHPVLKEGMVLYANRTGIQYSKKHFRTLEEAEVEKKALHPQYSYIREWSGGNDFDVVEIIPYSDPQLKVGGEWVKCTPPPFIVLPLSESLRGSTFISISEECIEEMGVDMNVKIKTLHRVDERDEEEIVDILETEEGEFIPLHWWDKYVLDKEDGREFILHYSCYR